MSPKRRRARVAAVAVAVAVAEGAAITRTNRQRPHQRSDNSCFEYFLSFVGLVTLGYSIHSRGRTWYSIHSLRKKKYIIILLL